MLRRAAVAATCAPTAPEPVKLTARTSGAATSAAPTAGPVPSTTLNTPAGIPAACADSASSTATCDDISAGLSTTVLPNASAGAAFQSGIASGKFHGVIRPTTPNGSCSVNWSAPGACAGITSPTA